MSTNVLLYLATWRAAALICEMCILKAHSLCQAPGLPVSSSVRVCGAVRHTMWLVGHSARTCRGYGEGGQWLLGKHRPQNHGSTWREEGVFTAAGKARGGPLQEGR